MTRTLATACVCGMMIGWAGLVFAQGERPGQRPPGSGGPPPNPLVRLFDADRDGALSTEEIAASAEKLRELDKDKDGKLSDEELRAAMPFGPGRPPFEPGGMPGGPRGQVGRATSFDAPLLPKDDAEKKIFDAIEQAQRGPRFANVPTTDGRLLRLLTEAIGAKNVVEIGTSTGESGMWFAMALRTTGGHLSTHEIDPGRAKTAEENFRRAGVDKLITVRTPECTGCYDCVAVCPAEGALWMSAGGARRRLPGWAMAAAVGLLFLGVTGYARWAGRWHTDLPERVYQELIPRAQEFSHP